MIHIATNHETWGRVPLCSRAMFDDLTDIDTETDCWECASIAGVSEITHPHLQEDS